MANWYGASRSNYIRVKNVDAALAALEPLGTDTRRHPTKADYICITGNDDDGSFNTIDHETDQDLEWSEWAKEHLVEGQVLVLVSSGAEKLRYVTGWAAAFDWRGQEVWVDVHRTLWDLMCEKFGVKPDEVADPSYTETYPK